MRNRRNPEGSPPKWLNPHRKAWNKCSARFLRIALETSTDSFFFFFLAGDAIAQLTDVGSSAPSPPDGGVTVFSDRTGMVKAARLLLSSVTKVLVLADRIVIKQIITSRNKVRLSHRRGGEKHPRACARACPWRSGQCTCKPGPKMDPGTLIMTG